MYVPKKKKRNTFNIYKLFQVIVLIVIKNENNYIFHFNEMNSISVKIRTDQICKIKTRLIGNDNRDLGRRHG